MDAERARKLIIETKARAAEWVTLYGRPNYPENLTLALKLAEELEKDLDAQQMNQ